MTKFDKKEFMRGFLNGFSVTFLTLLLLLLVCAMCGCKTQYVPMETVRTEYVRTDSSLYTSIVKMLSDIERSKQATSDSIIHRIRESVTKNEAGDTTDYRLTEYIYMSSREKAEYEKTIRERDDSIERLNTRLDSQKTDTIRVPYPVEKQLTKWEKTKMDLGGIAIWGVIALVIGAILVWLAKKYRK